MSHKILVIDDDLYIRELYEEILQNAGYDVQTAEDGEIGISKLKEGGFDLILLDLMMPKVDGIGVLTSLIDNPPAVKNGPIILLSNLGNDIKSNEAVHSQISDFLIKADITPDQLLNCVKKHLPD